MSEQAKQENAVLCSYGVKLEITPEGEVKVYSNKPVTVIEPNTDKILSVINDNKPFNVEELSADYYSVNLTVGQKMADGSIYAGVSRTTNTNLFAAPEDFGVMNWDNMVKYTENITDLCGRKGSKQSTEAKLRKAMKNGTEDGGWRAPTSGELHQLYQNKKEIGGFKMQDPWYWSSSEYDDEDANLQDFNDGYRSNYGKSKTSSVRCVWSVPRLAA